MKRTLSGAIMLSLALMSCQVQERPTLTGNYNVIPLPQEITTVEGEAFTITDGTAIVYKGDEAMKRNAEHLSAYIKHATGLELEVTDTEKENAK